MQNEKGVEVININFKENLTNFNYISSEITFRISDEIIKVRGYMIEEDIVDDLNKIIEDNTSIDDVREILKKGSKNITYTNNGRSILIEYSKILSEPGEYDDVFSEIDDIMNGVDEELKYSEMDDFIDENIELESSYEDNNLEDEELKPLKKPENQTIKILRWIAVIPASLGTMIITSLFFKYANKELDSDGLLMQSLMGVVGCYAFTHTGFYIAPNYKKNTLRFLTLIIIAIQLFFLLQFYPVIVDSLKDLELSFWNNPGIIIISRSLFSIVSSLFFYAYLKNKN
jgi:hypothetical protein